MTESRFESMSDKFKTLGKIMNILSALEDECKGKENKLEMYASSDEYQLLREKWVWNQNLGDYKCPNFTFEMEKLKIKQSSDFEFTKNSYSACMHLISKWQPLFLLRNEQTKNSEKFKDKLHLKFNLDKFHLK